MGNYLLIKDSGNATGEISEHGEPVAWISEGIAELKPKLESLVAFLK
jgi:hypothetical protein